MRQILQALLSIVLLSGLIAFYWEYDGIPDEATTIVFQVTIVQFVALMLSYVIGFFGKKG
mgnify:CR=1 FL=1